MLFRNFSQNLNNFFIIGLLYLLLFLFVFSISSCATSISQIPACELAKQIKVCSYIKSTNKIFCVKKDDPYNKDFFETHELQAFLNEKPILMKGEDYARAENCRTDAIEWAAKHCKR